VVPGGKTFQKPVVKKGGGRGMGIWNPILVRINSNSGGGVDDLFRKKGLPK